MLSVSPLIEFQQLTCIRDDRVLFSGLDCTIDSGDMVCIKGPNGCGKTTLLRALTLLLPEFEGNILWRGQSILQAQYEFLSELLFVGHLPGIKKTLTPRENLRFLSNLSGQYTDEQIDYALAQVGLYGYEDMPGHQLSAGQGRRIALARLYLTQAQVWVLDEPYTALDIQGITRLEQRFKEHAEQGGCIIITSHQEPTITPLKSIYLPDFRGASITRVQQVSDV